MASSILATIVEHTAVAVKEVLVVVVDICLGITHLGYSTIVDMTEVVSFLLSCGFSVIKAYITAAASLDSVLAIFVGDMKLKDGRRNDVSRTVAQVVIAGGNSRYDAPAAVPIIIINGASFIDGIVVVKGYLDRLVSPALT